MTEQAREMDEVTRSALAEAWERGYNFAYWQERGHDGRMDVPPHLAEDIELWNPFRTDEPARESSGNAGSLLAAEPLPPDTRSEES